MADATQRQQAVDALARQVVADVSPAELPLFGATAARYHADPAATLATKPSSDETLGFGAETVAVLVAPYALDLIQRLFAKLADRLGESAADGLTHRILSLFGRDRHESAVTAAQADPLTPEQLSVIGETARAEAAELALPKEQSEALANAVVAALATRT